MNIKKTLLRLNKSSNIKNSYWIIGAQIFQMILSFFVGAVSARYLGPTNYGIINYTASFVAFFSSIITLGMDGVVLSSIIAKPEKEGELLGSAIVFQILSSCVSSVLIFLLVIIINPDQYLKLVLSAIQSLQLYFISVEIIDVWFQKRLLSKYTSFAKIIASIVVSIYKIIILVLQKDIIFFAFANVLTDLIVALTLLLIYKSLKGPRLKFSLNIGKKILGESYHFIFADVMSSLYIYMDKIMIGNICSDFFVGIYTAATTISTLWLFVPNAIITSFRPMIFEIKQNGNQQLYERRLRQFFSGIIYVCLFFLIIVTFFSKIIISILYGSDYISGVRSLKLIVWAKFFAAVSLSRSVWIISEKKNKFTEAFTFIGVITNFFMNFLLIPRFGIDGAAVATLLTEFVVCIIAPILFKQTRIFPKMLLESLFLSWAWNNKN